MKCALVIVMSLCARNAFAQACCAGAAAFAPARLQIHEDYLLGVQVKASEVPGSFDGGEHFLASKNASEGDFEESLNGTVRLWPHGILSHGQISGAVPFDETYRSASGLGEFGGGIGDVQLNARWDFTYAGQSLRVPGLALLAGVIFPSGLPPESAKTPLAVDATGAGAWQGAFGAAIEQSFFGHLLLNLTGSVTIQGARNIAGIHAQDAPQGFVFGAVGWGFESGPAIAATGSCTFSGDQEVNGVRVTSTSRKSAELGLAFAAPLSDAWRLQASLFSNPPLDTFGRNQPATLGATFMIIWSWS